MKIDYHNKRFRLISTSENSETTDSMEFHYQQAGNILTADYDGGNIISGHLIGLIDKKGCIDMRYHQINSEGRLMTGHCNSEPEIMRNGKIRLYESWEWTCGDKSKGSSVLEEI